jgi:hypothetical protein
LGLGTTNAVSALTVNRPSSGNVATFVAGTSNLVNEYSGITLSANVQGADIWYASEIRSINTNSTPDTLNPRLTFFTQNTGTYLPANRTEKMTILGNGNVGIGTSSPSNKLDVNGSGYFGGALTTASSMSANSLYVTAAIITYNVVQFAVTNSYSFTPPNMVTATSENSQMRMYMVWVWGANGPTYGGVRVWMIAVNGPGTAYTVNTILGRDADIGTGLDLARTSTTQLTITSNGAATVKWVGIMQLNTNT